LLVEHEAAVLVDRLKEHEPKIRVKWVDRPAADQSVPNTRSPASPSPGLM